MIIYLARHAEQTPVQGASDREKMEVGLSRYGRLEAKALAKAMKKRGVDHVYSSGIQRAKETAEIVAKTVGVLVIQNDNLREFFAAPEVRNTAELKALKLEAYEYPGKHMPSGESLDMAVARLKETILAVASSGGTPCIMSHSMILEKFLSESFGFRSGEYAWMKTAAATAIEVDANGNMVLKFANRRFRDGALLFETLKRMILKRYE